MALGSTAAFQTGFGPTQSTGGFSNTAFGTAGIVGGFGFPIPGVDPLFSFTAAASSFTLQKLLGFANGSGTNINVGPIPSNMGMVGGILNGTPFFSNPSSLGGLAGDNPLAGALGSFLPGYGQGDNSGNGAGFSGLGNGTPFDNYVGGGQGGPQGAGNPYAQGRFPNGSIPGNPYPPGANGQQPNYALGNNSGAPYDQNGIFNPAAAAQRAPGSNPYAPSSYSGPQGTYGPMASPYAGQQSPYGQMSPYGAPSPYGGSPISQQPYGSNPYATSPFGSASPLGAASPYGGIPSPLGANSPYNQLMNSLSNPYASMMGGMSPMGGMNPLAALGANGLNNLTQATQKNNSSSSNTLLLLVLVLLLKAKKGNSTKTPTKPTPKPPSTPAKPKPSLPSLPSAPTRGGGNTAAGNEPPDLGIEDGLASGDE